jgi:hypothetical protein
MNSLLDTTGAPLPAYAAIKSLVHDKFMTQASGPVDASGIYKYRGFRGSYEITAKKGPLIGIAQVTVGIPNGDLKLTLTEENGKFVIAGGNPVTLADLGADVHSAAVFSGPEILAEAGMPIQFTGLRNIRSLEILNSLGVQIKAFDVIGDRILWDRTDTQGHSVSKGNYLVRSTSLAGATCTRRVRI